MLCALPKTDGSTLRRKLIRAVTTNKVVNAETVDSPEKYMDADLESAADRRNASTNDKRFAEIYFDHPERRKSMIDSFWECAKSFFNFKSSGEDKALILCALSMDLRR